MFLLFFSCHLLTPYSLDRFVPIKKALKTSRVFSAIMIFPVLFFPALPEASCFPAKP